jgi:alkylated DNA repair dioxygenase AlkB
MRGPGMCGRVDAIALASSMQRQLDLFGARRVGFDASFSALRRDELADAAWLDHVPGWVRGHDALFDELEASLEWRTEKRRMYDRHVMTPRLLASVPTTAVAGGAIEDMRRALSERYGEDFVRTTAALYRDGNDSVAWHGDTTARDMDTAIVATISLGQPRKFLLRPTAGGPSIAYQLGRGDLVVMGGTCQRTWRHAIPKVAHAAGPRIAVMFRPAWSQY